MLAGLLYRVNFLGLQRLRLPHPLVELFAGTLGRVLTGPGQPQQVFVTPTAGQMQQQHAGGGHQQFGSTPGRPAAVAQRTGGAAAPTVEPSPEALQQLVAMGFDEGSAAQALQRAGNNVEAALQFLL